MAEKQYIISAIDGFKAIVGQLSDGHTLTLEQAKFVSDFYAQLKDTNTLISEAEAMAHDNPDALSKDVGSLDIATKEFLSIAASNTTSDFKELCDVYIAPYEHMYEESKAAAHKAWMEYQSMSNRLDYLPLDSDEYAILDKECDAAKADYDRLNEAVGKSYDALRAEEMRIASVYFFEMSHLVILAERIKNICESIQSDIKKLHKEGLI